MRYMVGKNLIINKTEEQRILVWRRLRSRRGIGRIFKYLLDHDVEKRLELFCVV